MTDKDIQDLAKQALRLARITSIFIAVMCLFIGYYMIDPDFSTLRPNEVAQVPIPSQEDRDLIEDGIHLRTGLIDDEGLFLVVNNCTNCHSAKLVTQNPMSAERWNETITWMQETQGLWDLGESQEIIVNYLVKNYPPKRSGGRRANLTDIEWYESDN